MQHLLFNQPFELSVFRAIGNSLDLSHYHHPLLQNLNELTFRYHILDGPSDLQNICMFLGPRLTKLSFSIPSSTTGIDTFFTAVKSRCPSLSSLCIQCVENADKVGRAVSNLVCGLLCLQETMFSGFTLDCEAQIFLASLPGLRKLHLRLSRGPALRTFSG